MRVPEFREPPRAIVKALARYVDIVGIEHAMHEPGDHIRCGEVRDTFNGEVEQLCRRIVARCFIV